MQLNSDQTNGILVLRLQGRFDAHETAQVREWFQANPTKQAVVNLSDVSFLDSSALSVLVQEMKRCRERGGDLILAGLPKAVRIIFELTRLDRAFRIVATEAEAIAQLKSS